MDFDSFFIILNGVVQPGEMLNESNTNNAETVAQSNIEETPIGNTTQAQQGSWIYMILIYAAVFSVFYLLFMRPNSKRQKRIREMQSSLKAGDNVLTTTGLYGKIASVGQDCFLVEFGTNKAIIIPVDKKDIVAIKEPAI